MLRCRRENRKSCHFMNKDSGFSLRTSDCISANRKCHERNLIIFVKTSKVAVLGMYKTTRSSYGFYFYKLR